MPEPEPLLNLRGDLTGFALFLIAGYLRVLLKVVLTSHIQLPACSPTNATSLSLVLALISAALTTPEVNVQTEACTRLPMLSFHIVFSSDIVFVLVVIVLSPYFSII